MATANPSTVKPTDETVPLKEDEVSVRLMELEARPDYTYMQGVTTATFYQGDANEAHAKIRARLLEVAKTSPWIVGKFGEQVKKEIRIVHPKNVTEEHLDPVMGPVAEAKGDLTPSMDYCKMYKVMQDSDAHLPYGATQISKKEHVFRVSVLKTKDPELFCVVVSLAHVVGDGHTYYFILNQLLNSTAPLLEIKAERKHGFEEDLKKDIPPAEKAFLQGGAAMMGNLLAGACCCCGDWRAYSYFLDSDAVAKIKAEAKETPFVSTNDIITSHFANVTNSRVCLLTANMRGRMDGIEATDGGNYEWWLLLDPEMSSQPSDVRKLLLNGAPYTKREGSAVPSFCEGLSGTFSMIGNWATFSKTGEFTIDGCEQLLHLPITQKATDWPVAIVYWAKPGKLAVIYFMQAKHGQNLLEKSSPLGDCVSPDGFEH